MSSLLTSVSSNPFSDLVLFLQVMDAEIWDEKKTKKDQTGPHYFVHYKGWNKKQVSRISRYDQY